MSKVTKCDVCGAIFGYDPEEKCSNVSVHTSKHFYDPATDSYADLCPDCTKKMLEFIEVLKSGNRYVIWQDESANLIVFTQCPSKYDDDANLCPKEE